MNTHVRDTIVEVIDELFHHAFSPDRGIQQGTVETWMKSSVRREETIDCRCQYVFKMCVIQESWNAPRYPCLSTSSRTKHNSARTKIIFHSRLNCNFFNPSSSPNGGAWREHMLSTDRCHDVFSFPSRTRIAEIPRIRGETSFLILQQLLKSDRSLRKNTASCEFSDAFRLFAQSIK